MQDRKIYELMDELEKLKRQYNEKLQEIEKLKLLSYLKRRN